MARSKPNLVEHARKRSRESGAPPLPASKSTLAGESLDDLIIRKLEKAISALRGGSDERAKLERELVKLRRSLKAKPSLPVRKVVRDIPVEEIRTLSLKGTEITAIAGELQIPQHWVVQVRRRLGLGNCRARQIKERIANLNEQGLNDRLIAQELGLSRPYVCTVRNRLGIAPVSR